MIDPNFSPTKPKPRQIHKSRAHPAHPLCRKRRHDPTPHPQTLWHATKSTTPTTTPLLTPNAMTRPLISILHPQVQTTVTTVATVLRPRPWTDPLSGASSSRGGTRSRTGTRCLGGIERWPRNPCPGIIKDELELWACKYGYCDCLCVYTD